MLKNMIKFLCDYFVNYCLTGNMSFGFVACGSLPVPLVFFRISWRIP